MKKDFAKRELKENSTSDLKSAFIICLFIIVICMSGFLAYQYKKNPQFSLKQLLSSAQIKSWFKRSKREISATVKEMTVSKNEEEKEIHFEFYNVLPNMQVSVSEPNKREIADIAIKTAKPNLVNTQMTEIPKKTLPSALHFFNSQSLEKDFADRIKSSSYVIQLGVFKNASLAEHFRQKVDKAFNTHIVKILLERETGYRVQVGPFTDKSQIKLVQRQLQQKGINGIVRKLE